jgi:hypothetical protein
MIIEDYQAKGFLQVTRANLDYQLLKHNKSQLTMNTDAINAISVINLNDDLRSGISPTSGDSGLHSDNNEGHPSCPLSQRNVRGSKKGTTKQAKLETLLALKEAITEASDEYLNATASAKSSGGKGQRKAH